jgi:GNAT superfamily N-acetyltransferase
VNSPAFKRWFGQSKVVDAQGEPLVVYHGTRATDISEFRPDGGRDGVWQDTLERFRRAQRNNEQFGYMGFRSGTFFGPAEVASAYAGEDADSSGVIYPVYVKAENPIYIDWRGGKKVVSGTDPTRTPDALIIRRDGEISQLAVIDPTQVKSATGNAGTFDPNDPRIAYNPARRRRNPEDAPAVVRLTGFRNKYGAAAEAFLRDLFDASYPNPLNPRERILAGIEVAVEVSPLRGGVHLDEVRALRPGKGEGTKAMRFLAELADKHGVTMTLFPMPFGDQKMDTDDLVRFYRKHGFRFESEESDEDDEDDSEMIRFPRHANPRGLDVRRGIPGTYRAQFVAKGGRSRAYPAHAGAPWDRVMVRLASETTLSGGRMYDAVMRAAREGRTTVPGKRGAVSVRRVTNPRKPDDFEPPKPLIPGYQYRVKRDRLDDMRVAVFYGSKQVANIDAYWQSMQGVEERDEKNRHERPQEPPCAPDLRSLGAKGTHPNVFAVANAFIYDSVHKGKGIGRAMYQAMMIEGFAVRENRIEGKPGPMFFVPDVCSGTGNTSPYARRVWASLAREYPSAGMSIRVDASPVIGSRPAAAPVTNPRKPKPPTLAEAGLPSVWFHGTQKTFARLKAQGGACIWLADEAGALAYATPSYGRRSAIRLIEVTLAPDTRVVDLADASDPAVLAFIHLDASVSNMRWHGREDVTDAEMVDAVARWMARRTHYDAIEARPWAKAHFRKAGADALLVRDVAGWGGHAEMPSLCLLNAKKVVSERDVAPDLSLVRAENLPKHPNPRAARRKVSR